MPHAKKQMASFFLTTRCNLSCEYCYNKDERSQIVEQSLPLEIAKAGVDFFFSKNSSRHIRFYGPGEPTQEMGLMKHIVNYAKSAAGDELLVELQTNGVFSEREREWLLDNINIMWISFDGEPDIHDAQRHFPDGSPSSPFIEENVKWLFRHKKSQHIMIGARVTITDCNIERQKNMIDYFLSLGIKHIWSDPIFPSVGTIPVFKDKEKMEEFHFDMDRYVDTYIEASRYAQDREVFYGSFLTCNFDGDTSKHCRACTPTPHFTPDGYISACDLVTFGENAHHMDCFVYGRWNPEEKKFDVIEDKLIALQQRSTENMEHCKTCSAQTQCGGYCLGEVMNETGNLLGQKPKTCKAIRRLLTEIGTSNTLYPFMHP